jgi:hypothetical protein
MKKFQDRRKGRGQPRIMRISNHEGRSSGVCHALTTGAAVSGRLGRRICGNLVGGGGRRLRSGSVGIRVLFLFALCVLLLILLHILLLTIILTIITISQIHFHTLPFP